MSRPFNFLCAFSLLMVLTACTTSVSKPSIPAMSSADRASPPNHNQIATTPIPNHELQGKASWYARTEHGMRTASGEIYDLYGLTAAHASLPFSTPLRVTHLQTGEEVVVIVNDRLSEWNENVLVKLSYQAAHQIGLLKYPSSQVRIQSLPRNLLFPSRSEKRE